MPEPVPLTSSASYDWIEDFLDYTAAIPSPRIFRLWSAIAAIGGALERRVWVVSAGQPTYPNLYVLLVGHPGSGKTQAIKHTNNLWYSCRNLHIAPHDITKARLIDRLAKASRKMLLKGGTLYEYNCLLIAADEFGVLLPSHDTEFLSTLNRIFDNPSQHGHERRMLGDKQIDIINPQITILAGTQPSYLANLLPEEAWGQGFMSRVFMVYSNEKRRKIDIFDTRELSTAKFKTLSERLLAITKLYGPLSWSFPAAQAAQKWIASGMQPEPEHSKLEHYNSRRTLNFLKLLIISTISSAHKEIELSDYTRAQDWMLQAELAMPDIFREMVGRSDIQIIDELHFFLWKIYSNEKKGIHQARIYDFLRNRCPAEKIPRIIDVAIKANIIEQFAGTELYRPRPRHEHGME
jgi:Protein of unknown function (DUF3987)